MNGKGCRAFWKAVIVDTPTNEYLEEMREKAIQLMIMRFH
jgi:hypothetical protein